MVDFPEEYSISVNKKLHPFLFDNDIKENDVIDMIRDVLPYIGNNEERIEVFDATNLNMIISYHDSKKKYVYVKKIYKDM